MNNNIDIFSVQFSLAQGPKYRALMRNEDNDDSSILIILRIRTKIENASWTDCRLEQQLYL